MESVELHRTLTGDPAIDNNKYKWRVGSLDPRHNAVAAYATQIRIVFYHDHHQDMAEEFIKLCEIAGLPKQRFIVLLRPNQGIETIKKGFFTVNRIEKLHRLLAQLPWSAAFQMEALLRNGLLHTELVEELLPRVYELCQKHQRLESVFVGELLRKYNQTLQTKNTPANQEHPMKVFDEVCDGFDLTDSDLASGNFRCGHVTFTPTRTLLEGPYPTQSNRIIRQYDKFADNFIRVDFRDEDRLQYRWDKAVDGTRFLRERVGGILKGGFQLAGRSWEFLAYSTSALREHAVWFICPFDYVKDSGETVYVNGKYIRDDIGDFHGTDLMRHPSKYAARLAQAFTATDPSVCLHRRNWEEIPDIEPELETMKSYVFTDGVGTISHDLARRIWTAMCEGRRGYGNLVPSAVGRIARLFHCT
jgi:RNA-dependent RNA polymerase